ncbi:hypothetical protein D3C83_78780 [compost metagenome]
MDGFARPLMVRQAHHERSVEFWFKHHLAGALVIETDRWRLLGGNLLIERPFGPVGVASASFGIDQA